MHSGEEDELCNTEAVANADKGSWLVAPEMVDHMKQATRMVESMRIITEETFVQDCAPALLRPCRLARSGLRAALS